MMGASKKILVTGGAGYIGSHTVVQLVEAGYDVVIVDNLSRSDRTLIQGIEKIIGKQIPFYQADCTKHDELDAVFGANRIDAVIHFAAYKAVGESVEQPVAYYQNNLGSLITLLQVMKKRGVAKLIFSSSCTVYGQPDTVPVTEETPEKPASSPYGATKQMCERILRDAALAVDTVSLRYFNPVGAHPSAQLGELPIGVPNNLVPFITQTAAGVRKQLTVFGNDYNTPDGTCIRDYIHVMDLAEAHIKALEFVEVENGFHVFNVGTGEGSSVKQLIDAFADANNIAIPFAVGPRRSGDVEQVYADSTRARALLHWKPRFSVKEALLHAWQWERKVRSIQ